jgi:hypothetical protein
VAEDRKPPAELGRRYAVFRATRTPHVSCPCVLERSRIKIYETMAMSKAVVSMRIGSVGLPVAQPQDNLLFRLDWTRQTGLRFRGTES